jgi:toxin ParE1/3/4
LILRLHRRAEAEIREAAEWYGERTTGLDRRFVQAVRAAFESLERDSEQFAKLETIDDQNRIRRFLVQGFPYLIIYESFENEVFVYAVAHASRRPNYWRRRKRDQP